MSDAGRETQPPIIKQPDQGNVPVTRHSRADFVAVLLCVLVAVGLWAPRLRGPLDLRWDASVYYILGTSLAQGSGYRLLNEPGQIEAVQYPPLLPAMIAISQKVMGTSDPVVVATGMRKLYLMFSVLHALLTYRLIRRYFNPMMAGLGTVAMQIAFFSYYLSDVLYTEIPFAILTLSLLLWSRRPARPGYLPVATLLVWSTYLLRTAGLAVLVAWVAESFLRRQYKQALVRLSLAVLPVLAWNGYVYSVVHSESYKQVAYAYQRADYQYSNVTYAQNVTLVDPFKPELGHIGSGTMLTRALTHPLYVPESVGMAITAHDGFWKWPIIDVLGRLHFSHGKRIQQYLPELIWVPIIALGLLALAGIVVLFRRGDWLAALYVFLATGMVCLTPWPEQFQRYLFPMASIFVLTTMLMARSIIDFARQRDHHVYACVALAVVIFVPAMFVSSFTVYRTMASGLNTVYFTDNAGKKVESRQVYYTAPWTALDDALDYVSQHASRDAIVSSTTPHGAFLRTGLKCILHPLEADRDREIDLLEAASVSYVITDELKYPGISQRYVAPALEKHPDRWTMVFESRRTDRGSKTPSKARVFIRTNPTTQPVGLP